MSEDTRKKTVYGDVINPDMSEGRYQDTLRRFRQRIVDGIKLVEDDSNFPCAKHTSCSWGLCECLDESAYPDANDHVFPVDFLQRGRLTPRSVSGDDKRCPMDRDDRLQDKQHGMVGRWGCFYRCRIFRSKPRGSAQPTREEAIKLYDDLIAERETKHGKRTAADDGEDQWQPSGPRSQS